MALRRLMVVGLLVLLVSTVIAVVAQQATPTGNVVIVESIFVRSGPAQEFGTVGALYAGDIVRPLNISDDGEWILIIYRRQYGWIQRSLVQWENEPALDRLPTLLANVTPTSIFAPTETPFLPTFTPEGSYIIVTEAAGVFVRGGPGRGYLRLGGLKPGDLVEPVARNFDTSWIMIRFVDEEIQFDGFAWIGRRLVNWLDGDALDDLPVIFEDNLTPSPTFTPSNTPEPTATYTATQTATFTPTSTATFTATATSTNEPTATYTPVPTDTATNTLQPSATVVPATVTDLPTETPSVTVTALPTETALWTIEPSATYTALPTLTITPSYTPEPKPTEVIVTTSGLANSAFATNTPPLTPEIAQIATNAPTDTPSAVPATQVLPTATPTPTLTSTPTVTATFTETASATFTATDTATNTVTPSPEPTNTATATPTVTNTPTIIPTATLAVAILPATSDASATQQPTNNPSATTTRLPAEVIVAVILIAVLLGYALLYWRGLADMGRYQQGFVVETCPICGRGHLTVDIRVERFLGIPRARRTVRCDTCRSLLRETGREKWRYAVDRLENPDLYERLNGREITESQLIDLVRGTPSGVQPSFDDPTSKPNI